MNYLNRVIISKGLFGRLSLLSADRAELFDMMQDCIDDHYYSRDFMMEHFGEIIDRFHDPRLQKPSPESEFYRIAIHLIQELSALVETIVLSDQLFLLSGFTDSQSVLPDVGHVEPGGWLHTLVWPEEANEMIEFVMNEANCGAIGGHDSRIIEVSFILKVFSNWFYYTYLDDCFSDDGIDWDRFWDYYLGGASGHLYRPLIPEEDYDRLAYTAKMSSFNKLIAFMETYLGSDWSAYREIVGKNYQISSAVKGTRDLYCSRISDLDLQLTMYFEHITALEKGTLSLSSLSNGLYFDSFSSQMECHHVNIRNISIKSYNDKLLSKLEEYGVCRVDLRLAPLFRLCLNGSNSVFDVIRRAVELRNEKWVIAFRHYLSKLTSENRPVQIVRNLQKLDTYIESELAGKGVLANSSLGLSLKGLSLKIPNIRERVLRWRNPAIMMHTQIQSALAGTDALDDLARVVKIPKSQLYQMISTD